MIAFALLGSAAQADDHFVGFDGMTDDVLSGPAPVAVAVLALVGAIFSLLHHGAAEADVSDDVSVDDRKSCTRPANASEPAWFEIDLNDAAERDSFLRRSRALLDRSADACLEHDVEVLIARGARGRDSVRVFAYGTGEEIAGYAPFRVENSALAYQIGEVSLFQRPVRRLTLNAGPLFTPGCDERAGLRALLSFTNTHLARGMVVFLGGVVEGSILHDTVTGDRSCRRLFYTLPHGPLFQRRFIHFPGSFDAYMATLGKRTREGLRRSRRKLKRHVDGDVVLRKFTRENEVDEFLDQAIEVSKKTYQWKLLQVGLRNRETLHRYFALAARNGHWRCYTLLCAGRPVAFMVGHRLRDTYHYEDVGFDPEWTKWSVGSVLQIDMLEDLMADPDGPARFDFQFGDGYHKRRFANHSHNEGLYYLIPRTARGWVLARSLQAVNALSMYLGNSMERLGLKDRIRNLIRRRAVARARRRPDT